jgi:hypothetical protein
MIRAGMSRARASEDVHTGFPGERRRPYRPVGRWGTLKGMSVQGATRSRVRERARARARPDLRARLWWVKPFARDFSITLAIILVYFLLRAQAPGNEGFAMSVTRVLIDFEKDTHTFWEPQIQEVSIHFHVVQEIANFIYAYGHFPVLFAVGAWLWFVERKRFVFMRNVMYISMVFGLIFYYALPAAPPRLLAAHGYDLGFTDTVFGGNTAVSYAQPSLILNEYAAIPSFHFGWIALASACIWINTRNWWVRAFSLVLSVVMSWAIIASANHFWVDMAMGGILVAVAWYLAKWLGPYLERRRAARAAAGHA